MRIGGGKSGGRRLSTGRGMAVRPTSSRIKKTIFDILGDQVEGKAVLDLFAGTGNLGIEALSRGAKTALFVENSSEALRLVERNLSQCGLTGQAEILPGDVLRAIGILKGRGTCFDLIFVDPPYERGWVQKTLVKLHAERIYGENVLLVVQHDRREPLPHSLEGWTVLRERRIGDTILSFLGPRSSPNETE